MKAKLLLSGLVWLALIGLTLVPVDGAVLAQDAPKIVKLPEAVKTGGPPLLEALAKRKSDRGLTDKALTESELSNLLWAATGVNRADGHWTIPTAKNQQEVSVYMISEAGVYRYLPDQHALEEISSGDQRKKFNIKGALELIVVLDETKATPKGQPSMDNASISAGAISQNVYLYGASTNLGTVVKKTFDAKALTEALKLSPQQKIIIVQPVGYLN